MERPYHRYGFRVHSLCPHRELLGRDPERPGPVIEVHADMALKREQEESDCRCGQDAHRTSSGVRAVRYAVYDRTGPVDGKRLLEDKALRLWNNGVQRSPLCGEARSLVC